MKRSSLVVLASLAGLASVANAQITGSRHDFSNNNWSNHEICRPCHTTHFTNAAAGALWNHTLTTQNFTMFEGETGAAADVLDTDSILCLSCHDGVTALDSFGGMTGSETIAAAGNIGTDLQNDHPIGADAVYPTTTSTRFNAQNASHKVVSSWGSLSLRLWIDPADGSEKYTVSCRTCHNVHNAGNYGHMLYFSNTASRLCLTCHIK